MLNSPEHIYLNKQGQQFLENQNIYSSNFTISGLESNEQIQPITENMETMNNHVEVQSNKSVKLDKYEKDFQKTIVEYNKTYQELSESRLKRTKSLSNSKQYLGKVISEDDGNYYYINDYGFTHKYSTDSWNNNDKSCPTTVTNASADLFITGPDMVSGQPCKLAGKNIRNLDTNEAAWVDIKGYKHVYPEDVWAQKSSSCSNKIIQITSQNYDLIPEGSPMTNTTICDTLDVNPNVWIHLKKLNKKLTNLAKKMANEIEKIHIKDEVMSSLLADQKKQLNTYVSKLDIDRSQLSNERNQLITISGEEENSELIMTANLYKYIFIFILSIFVIIITLRVTNADYISSKTFILVSIIGIIGMYYIYQTYKDSMGYIWSSNNIF